MTSASSVPAPLVPNHHAHHPHFSGLMGWLAARSMRRGRTSDAELAMRLTHLGSGDRVVDIGCGPGVAARLAAARGATVTGVDPAAVMLRVARRDDRAHSVTWQIGAAEALPMPDCSCDVAWSLSAVHHWPDVERGLSEVVRVLAPGGRFLATERHVDPGARGLAGHGWSNEQAALFAEQCADAGLRDVEVSRHTTTRGLLLTVRGVTHRAKLMARADLSE